jgi:hypothetical protein
LWWPFIRPSPIKPSQNGHRIRHHAGSLRLNVCEFDYLCPFLGFVSDELAECDRRHRHRFDAEGEKAPLQIGIADAGDSEDAERLIAAWNERLAKRMSDAVLANHRRSHRPWWPST